MRNALKPSVFQSTVRALSSSSALYRTAFASMAFIAATAGDAVALPTGAEIESGSISLNQPSSTQLIVNQASDRAVINWQNFDILHGESTQFVQPNSSSIALNRVRDGNPTQILGKLSANGKLVLVNPNGVFFGAGSTVDVAGLVASTADISTNNFNAGKMVFDRAGNPDAVIENQGTITAAEKGLVAFVAPTVINNGIIQAKAGTVKLASGSTMTVDMYGDDLYSFAVGTGGKGVTNSGTISAEGGTVMLTANAAKDVVSNVVNNTGIIEASSAHSVGGTIVIGGGEGNVRVGGKLKATGTKGGSVTVTGKNIELAGADIDASGKTAGGNVRIGGDYQGGGTLPHADTVTADAATKINVSATESGNGGTAVIWSDKATQFAGSANASAGVAGGNGGLVEVSSKGLLNYMGSTVARGINGGKAGKLLLDPANVVVDAALAASTILSLNADTDVTISTDAPGTDSGFIVVFADIIWNGIGSLFLDATSDIVVASTIQSTTAGVGGNINLTAGHDILIGSNGIPGGNGGNGGNGGDASEGFDGANGASGANGISFPQNFSGSLITDAGNVTLTAVNDIYIGGNGGNGGNGGSSGSDGVDVNYPRIDPESGGFIADGFNFGGFGGDGGNGGAGGAAGNGSITTGSGNVVLTAGHDVTVGGAQGADGAEGDYNSIFGFPGFGGQGGAGGVGTITSGSGDVTLDGVNNITMRNSTITTSTGDVLVDPVNVSLLNSSISGATVTFDPVHDVTLQNSYITATAGDLVINNDGAFYSDTANALNATSVSGKVSIRQTDAGSIQNAVDAIGTTGWGGAKVTLAAGTWNEQVFINQGNFTLTGQGNSTVIQAPAEAPLTSHTTNSGFTGTAVVYGTDGYDINVTNLLVDGNYLVDAGVVINNGGFSRLNNLTVEDVNGVGIGLDSVTNATIANNYVSNADIVGIAIINSPNATIRNNEVAYSAYADNGIGGIYAYDSASASIHNNMVHDIFNGNGITASNTSNVSIKNNHIWNIYDGNGIGLANLTGALNQVSDNNVDTVSQDSINIFNTENTAVFGNNLRNAERDGIHADTVSHLNAQYNTIRDVNRDGINVTNLTVDHDIYGVAYDNSIQNNTIYQTGRNGITADGVQNARINDNTVFNVSAHGITASNLYTVSDLTEMWLPEMTSELLLEGWYPGNQNQSQIVGNTVYQVGQNGIYVVNAENLVVSDNLIHDLGFNGIQVRDAYTSWPTSTLITGNTVYNTGINGIRGSYIENAQITGNTIYNIGDSSLEESYYFSGLEGMIFLSKEVLLDEGDSWVRPSFTAFHGINVDNLYVSGEGYLGPVLTARVDVLADSVDGGSSELPPEVVLLPEYEGAGRTVISDNIIHGIYQDGIHIEYSENVKASHNVITQTGKDGIYAYNLTVTNDVFDIPSDTFSEKLFVVDSGYIPESYWTNEFSDNDISLTGDNGIDLNYIENADVKYNEIHDMEGHGILAQNLYVTSTPENFRFSFIGHNHVYKTSADGIHVEGIQNAAVDGNHVHDVRANGIYMFNYPAGSEFWLPGNGDLNKSSVTNNIVHNLARDGIFLEGMNNVEVITNTVTNVGQAGISVVNTADSSVRLNTVSGTATGLLFVYSDSADAIENIITGNFIGANVLSSSNALLTGNIFDGNLLGIVLEDSAFARIEGGSITTPRSEESMNIALTLRGASNGTIVKNVAFNGGNIGVLIDGPGFGETEELVGPSASMQFEGNGSTFTGQDYYFILQNGAMLGDEIDASQQIFDGTRAAEFTEAQLADAEDNHTSDAQDDSSVGNVFYKLFETVIPTPAPTIIDLAVLDDFQNNIRNRYRRGNFSYAGRAINLVVDPVEPGSFGGADGTNLSLLNNSPAGIASQLSALTPAAGGSSFNVNPAGTAQDFANLTPAAGGNQAEQLASLAPAAGGAAGGCGNSFLDGGYTNGFACSTNLQ